MLQESCDEVTIPHLCGSEPWMPSIGDHGEGHAAEGHAAVHPRAILGIMYISEMPSIWGDGELAAVHPTWNFCTCCTLVSYAICRRGQEAPFMEYRLVSNISFVGEGKRHRSWRKFFLCSHMIVHIVKNQHTCLKKDTSPFRRSGQNQSLVRVPVASMWGK